MKSTSPETRETTYGLSRWFYQRFAISWIAITGMALYFLYDGAIGYPKKNYTADLYNCVSSGRAGDPFPDLEGRFDTYSEEKQTALTAAHEAGSEGMLWANYARSKGLPGKAPKLYSASEIDEQFYFAIGLGFTSVVLLVWVLRFRVRHFLLRDDSFTTGSGETIAFDDVTEINLEKWERGVTWLTYQRRDSEEPEPQRVKIDEFFYSGTDAIYKAVYHKNPEVTVKGDLQILSANETSNS